MGTRGRKWGRRQDAERSRGYSSMAQLKPIPRARSSFRRVRGRPPSEIGAQAINGTFDDEVMEYNLACAQAVSEKGRGLTASEHLEVAIRLGYHRDT